jgi:asparagine synthase (glutamine-hydrolysing)
MCGICGIFGLFSQSREEKVELVKKMMGCLSHRGPDGEGIRTNRTAILGHRRLAIIDIERGLQPMVSENGRYSLIFNGEIYNYLELRKSLESKRVRFRTQSDTEVLLELLILEGEKALNQLNGMFAFAFHDNQTSQWILARDPFGVKPLYFCLTENEIVFASEIKALLEHPGVKSEQNWKALQHYLTFQFYLNGETLFKGIHEVKPGFYMKGHAGQIDQTVGYWDTSYQVNFEKNKVQFIEELNDLLKDSLRMQIRSDVPIGSHLSGGIDSSAITSLAAAHFDDEFFVFTGKFEEGQAYDEAHYAKLVVEKINACHHEVVPTAQQFVDLLPKLIYFLDQPIAGPGLFPQFLVSQLASKHVKVVLGGQGGDEVFGGYARYLIGYLEQALKGAILETQEEGEHVVTLSSIISNLSILKEYQALLQHFWKDGLFEDMDARYFRLIDRGSDIDKLLTEDAKNSFNKEEVFSEFQGIFNHPDTSSYINKMTHFDQKTLLPALLQVEDRVSMAVSLESRVPFLDTRIVDLITTAPPKIKFKGGKSKFLLKEAMRDILPKAIVDRKDKMGFPVPLKEWMEGGVVRDFVSEILLSKTCRERGLFKQKALEDLIQKEGAFGRQLWGILCLELWHREFIDSA